MKNVQKVLVLLILIALCSTVLFAQGVQEKPKAGGTLNVYSIMPEKYATKIFEEDRKSVV
jgi:iron(III) transport system substrate-binding protein